MKLCQQKTEGQPRLPVHAKLSSLCRCWNVCSYVKYFSSIFCKLLRRHYFLPIVLVTERGGVQHCVGVTRWLFCVTHIMARHMVSI